jgi:pyruvate ferredoxin oxidoreductase alpha subunit
MGTVADTALELLADDGDLLVVRVHAYRPFPAAALAAALGRASRVVVVDRAPAFGTLGPLAGDVRSVVPAASVVCGLGGVDVTPATLRWALDQGPARAPGPVYVPEGV